MNPREKCIPKFSPSLKRPKNNPINNNSPSMKEISTQSIPIHYCQTHLALILIEAEICSVEVSVSERVHVTIDGIALNPRPKTHNGAHQGSRCHQETPHPEGLKTRLYLRSVVSLREIIWLCSHVVQWFME